MEDDCTTCVTKKACYYEYSSVEIKYVFFYLWLFVGVGISNGRRKKRSRALHLQRSFCYLTSEMSNVYEHPIN